MSEDRTPEDVAAAILELLNIAPHPAHVTVLSHMIRTYGEACAAAQRERDAMIAEDYQQIIDDARVKAGYANSPNIAAAIRNQT